MSSSATAVTTVAKEATDILNLFPHVSANLRSNGVANHAHHDGDLSGYDEEQIRLMDETCLVIDEDDNPVGSASKKTCHLMNNIDAGLLHRAFSVFLFNSDNRLMLQQRASEKITFPDMWTNTCCSHPLVPAEIGTTFGEAIQGTKRAAQRKLEHELGIVPAQVPLKDFRFLTRIHYKAPSSGKWGEHEIDYILFIKADVVLKPNENEVSDTRSVSQAELEDMISDPAVKLTPWFRLICQNTLFEWWDKIDDGLEGYEHESVIRRMS